jgi:ketosteroid isomerase-like protein
MRYASVSLTTILILGDLIMFVGCQRKEDSQAELAKVDKVFQSYFDGISQFDYQAMRKACSSDYLLLEDGTVWSVEDHINFLKSLEGKGSIAYRFYDVKKTIDGSVAWRTHRNVADATIDGKPAHFEWIESVVFKRNDGEWKMAVLHSTTAKSAQK